ncbi:hypothetical protein [Pseudoalteromonas umbrosa]|uniref:hypothetical protein n=1 Tax=Pseudoalteromonas umbrosa TaxID=3048489 RepID=UPI0024C2E2F8|nr:hypothetical protein [Pseudoalteromonas sp. B95]MDK1290067.1 hypothetical protein [Pseudoalteromonas sp. B95]
MQASNIVRHQLINTLSSFVQREHADYTNPTFFMRGEPPTNDELALYMRDDWIRDRKLPSDPTSTLNAKLLGYVDNFMNTHSWARSEETVALANEQVTEAVANSTVHNMVKGLVGTPPTTSFTLATSHSQISASAQPITWSITLLNNAATDLVNERTHVIVNRVGTASDPTAEVVLSDNLVSTSQLTLECLEVYLPVFG